MSKTKQLGDGEADMLPEIQSAATSAATFAGRSFGLLDDAPVAPMQWTADYVGERLCEACRTIARLRMRVGPRQHASAWPGYQTMTPGEIAELINEAQRDGTLRQLYADLNRTSIPPSKEAIERAEEALGWPLKYLHAHEQLAQLVTGWAAGHIRRDDTPGPAREGLRIIARGLARDRVAVR